MFRRLWLWISNYAEAVTVIELQRQLDQCKEETIPKLEREISILKHEINKLGDVIERDRKRVEAEMSVHAKVIADNIPGE